MCGISGVLTFKSSNKEKIEDAVRLMNTSQFRRGPDDAGIIHSGPVVLGHQRLSIIDLSKAGHQPMEYDGIWITYNGEIYNFQELKKELIVKGYTFRTKTDTEVIIALYKEYGAEAFPKLRGMFAFGLWDSKRQKLFLVKDRYGIKPLYYWVSSKYVVFSSAVKALEKSGLVSTEQNPDAFIGFLLFGSVPLPMTTLKKVSAVPAGHYLEIRVDGSQKEIRYYNPLEYFQNKQNIRCNEIIPEVRKRLQDAVQSHLVSDAPLGVFLSGGLDSSVVAALAAASREIPIITLSIDFEEQEFSERKFQDMVAQQIGSDHRRVVVRRQDFFDEFDSVFEAMDQPTIDGVNTYFIAKAAKEVGLKTVLSGLGGDEMFLGYPYFKKAAILRMIQCLPAPLKLSLRLTTFFGDRYGKLAHLTKRDPIHFYLSVRGLFTPNHIAKILDMNVAEVHKFIKSTVVNHQLLIADLNNLHPIDLLSYLELKFYLQNQLLKDTDFMAMHHSVEVRVPLLDHLLVEYVSSLPSKMKLSKNVNKPLLVGAVRNILPDEIFSRSKMGFTFPFQKWLRYAPQRLVSSYKLPVTKHNWSRFWTVLVLSQWR